VPVDYSKYPPDWKEKVKKIKERSGDKCEKCGVKNHSTVYAVKAWVREYDGNKDTNKYKFRSIWFDTYGAALRFSDGKEEPINPIKIVCTTAHLDHDETNWEVDIDRLMFMCQMCHLRYDRKEKWRRKSKKWNI